MPFFIHPRLDFVLRPIEPGFAEPARTDAFLAERLRAIAVA